MAGYQHIEGNTGCLFLRGNCIPIYCLTPKEWILMDSGSWFDREELSSYLAALDIRVKAVLTSHAHYDHVGNHAWLREKFGCECIMTTLDAGVVHDAEALKSCFYSCTVDEIRKDFTNMLCKADRIIEDGAAWTEVCGVRFEVFGLPGHAASQIGFTTPDGVHYLGDCYLGPGEVTREKFVYMLDWKSALNTMERMEVLDGSVCILSHCGVYKDIKAVSSANREAFERVLESMRRMAGPEFSLEQMVRKALAYMNIPVKNVPKARLMERIIRSIVEYMAESGELDLGIKDGIIVYSCKFRK